MKNSQPFDPADIIGMSDEQLAELYENSRLVMDEMQQQSVAIRQELLNRANERATEDDWVAGEYAITKFRMVRFKTTIKQAKELGAVVTTEKVDTTKLRKLYDAGVNVPGASDTTDVRIRRIEEK